jgi:AraC-like DNA-binding protein
VSARQLQRRLSDAVGYGPKMLARVLRFRRLQRLRPAPLVELALDAGYADQAHMTAEVTALAGISPVRFLKDWTPTAA